MTCLSGQFWRGVFSAYLLLFALMGCKGQYMVPAAESYFSGEQLVLAKLVDQADPKAVYEKAIRMSLEDLNAFGHEKMTVLLYSARKTRQGKQWYAVVTSLIRAGADPLLQGLHGEEEATFMEWAIGNAYASKRLGLLTAALDADINPDTSATTESQSPLILKVAGQDGLGAIRLLVEYGADVNRRDAAGNSALSESIMTLGLDEVDYLLDHSANPQVTNYYGRSFAYLLSDQIEDLKTAMDPRLPKALAIRDRIIKTGIAWPPESPEQFRERVKAEHKKKTGKDFVFMPDLGYEAFVPKYVTAPVRKKPLQR